MVKETKKPDGSWGVSRSYMVGASLVAIESDDDGDGFFESMIVQDPASDDLEVFLRSKNGGVQVGSERLRSAYKRMFSAMETLWDEFGTDDVEADPSARLLELQRVIAVEQRVVEDETRAGE